MFRPKRGKDIIDHYAFIQPGTPLGDVATWRGALIGKALPGGVVTREAYEELSDEIVARLKDIVQDSGGLDGLWYDTHGILVSMSERFTDC